MFYELRTYTVKPGSLGDMVKAASSLARDMRKITTANLRAIG